VSVCCVDRAWYSPTVLWPTRLLSHAHVTQLFRAHGFSVVCGGLWWYTRSPRRHHRGFADELADAVELSRQAVDEKRQARSLQLSRRMQELEEVERCVMSEQI
jgi:hypothetical protein